MKVPPPNIHSFLFQVGIMEIRYIRMLANLCSLTYTMAQMTVSFTYSYKQLITLRISHSDNFRNIQSDL